MTVFPIGNDNTVVVEQPFGKHFGERVFDTDGVTTEATELTDLRVYVGFGDDPTIGSTILGSIRPTGSG